MQFELLYGFIPVIIFALTSITLVIISRQIGSFVVSFYRQIIVWIVGVPVLFLSGDFFLRVSQNSTDILLSWMFGSLYLFSIFKSCDYLEVNQSKVLNIVGRLLLTVVVWIVILGESMSLERTMWIVILILWISGYLFIKNENKVVRYNLWLGIFINILSAFAFVWGQYYFKKFVWNFSPLESAYLLEVGSIPFLFIFLLWLWKIKDMKKVNILSTKDKWLLFVGSATVLIGSYWLAMSYTHLSFIIVNVFLCLSIISSAIFSYLLLWEKITKIQWCIFTFIIAWIFIVNYFW